MIEHWTKVYTMGPCRGCGKKFTQRECIRKLCLLCRVPKDRRELVEYGVPWASADALMGILKRCGADAKKILSVVHPRLMQNIVIVGKTLKIRHKKYRWMRRNDWVAVT